MLSGLTKKIAPVIPWAGPLFALATATSLNAASVTLAWSPINDPALGGYRVYQGVKSQNYTNVIDVGTNAMVTIPGLAPGTTNYFAVTSYTSDGLESGFSGEITFAPNMPILARLQLTVGPSSQVTLSGNGLAGQGYDLLATSDLKTWSTLAQITMDSTGIFQYTDTSAPATGQRFYKLRQNTAYRPQLRVASNPVTLSGNGPAGYRYDVLASPNLRTWSSLAQITMDSNGTFQYTDASAPAAGQRFYRLRQASP